MDSQHSPTNAGCAWGRLQSVSNGLTPACASVDDRNGSPDGTPGKQVVASMLTGPSAATSPRKWLP